MSEKATEIGDLIALLNDEQIGEVRTLVAEIIERANGYLERGRSSMPIEIDSALILVAIAGHVVSPHGSEHSPKGASKP